ncbi:oligopeptide transport system ATP-binding protein [Pullulanibacillus pueri]|uniref:Peptide ABC transporter ATP-binding protein n=1 Tax=Pullulanibacillus pueri TaxID=1437324 RepID=A0A8J3EMX3_9BACL|nr:dipeptide ABC transporter ATP-binding protein [Pullulanibacillus pueri]MBM7682866.1 oligopeptide transport system ATP-binding protein [Pullulanibacillus pueri]GGH84329.1 peptide ABC transporter ATP-binding protein [Pullulanibacillus pueri]
MVESETLLEARNLRKYFDVKGSGGRKHPNLLKAVDGVSFSVSKGETLGIVGESGCGKSTTGRMLLRLIEPTAGQILFEGRDLTQLSQREMRKQRRHIQMVFQNPLASLNPRRTVGELLEQPLKVHRMGNVSERKQRVMALLKTVGLNETAYGRYPHQFSGGQRQRIAIARALAVTPKLIVADEPVSALDVSVQAQILNLLKDLQEAYQLTYLFISHDLGVVRHISDRVAVMYLGRIVEIASTEDLYNDPKHPYTQALISTVPIPDPEYSGERVLLQGDIPSASEPPSGCPFHTRCPLAMEACKTVVPRLQESEADHFVSCHLYHKVEA